MGTDPYGEPEAMLDALADFAERRGPPACYAGWPRDILRDYLRFHIACHQCAFLRHEGQVAGLFVAWTLDYASAREASLQGQELRFDWKPGRPDGDTLYISEFVGAREHWPGLVDAIRTRFPHWRRLRLFAKRYGRTHEFNPGRLCRHLQASTPLKSYG